MMTSKERVMTVLAGEIPDRVPWIENYISNEVAAGLRRNDDFDISIYPAQCRVPPDVRDHIPIDNLTWNFSPTRFTKIVKSGRQDIITDGLIKTTDDLKLLDTMPDPDSEELYRPAEEFIARFGSDAALFATVRTGVSNTYLSMGIEYFSTCLIRDPDLVKEVLERFCDWTLRVVKNARELPFDLFWVPDDLGFTNAPMMSMEHFREFCVPVMTKTFAAFDRPSVYHSDGNILPLLDEIIAMGPVAVANMEPGPMDIEQVKRDFGDRITLIGNIDLHYTLPQGTPEETRAETQRRIQVLGQGGRYILASANSLPDYVKPDNVRAMAATLLEHGFYPLAEPDEVDSGTTAVARPEAAKKSDPVQDGLFEAVKADLFDGNEAEIENHVRELLDKGIDAEEIMERGLVAAMDVVGEQFGTGELFIPEVLLSARVMNTAIKMLEPHLARKTGAGKGKILLGTVEGDMHSIGKNMVATMMRGAGYDVLDLGTNIPKEEFASTVAEYKPDVLGLSSLLTSTMPGMKQVIEALDAASLRNRVKIIIGGAPVNEKYAEIIGADGYATNAGEAVALIKRLMGDAA